MTSPLILLCAGGTGGHVFPARALGEELLARGFRIAFATDTRGLKYLDGMADVHLISAGPYRAGIKGRIVFALSLIKGYFEAHRLIGRLKPAAAVGFGGYPSAPPICACQHRGVPTLLHESNAVIGAANRFLAPFAKTIALSIPVKGGADSRKHQSLTGNPVRADIIALRDETYPKIESELNILIFGGSLGAKSFAEIVPHSIVSLQKDMSLKLKVAHQVRDGDVGSVTQVYQQAGIDAEIQSFFDDIPERLEKAHLLICRGGATTISENTCAGRPAIYIPYPWHKDRQQLHNARAVAETGGGWVLEEKDLTPERLHELLKSVAPGKLAEAAAFARSLGQPGAAGRLADQVIALVG